MALAPAQPNILNRPEYLNSKTDQNRPLAGLTVLVTRPQHQAESLAGPLRKRGATVRIEPMIEILAPTDWQEVDRAIEQISAGRFATLVFVSANGARYFVERMTKISKRANIAKLQVVSIGNQTSEVLSKLGVPAQTSPGNSDSRAIADFLIEQHSQTGPILIVRANRGSDVLPTRLQDANVDFQQVVAYRSVDRTTVSPESLQSMAAGEIDWVTATSSAIATSLARLFGDALTQTKIVSISPTTSKTLRELGHAPTAEARDYNMNGIVDAIIAAESDL